jgi:hypothetical protein
MKILAASGAMLALLLAVSCGGSGSNDPSPTPSMTGTWTFTSNSQIYESIVSGSATLQQNGNTITGNATLVGSPCATSASITGTLYGNSLSMQLNENGDTVTFTGKLDSTFTSASGSYSASLGCTNADQGTWTASKQ